jgi:hypothetical protein
MATLVKICRLLDVTLEEFYRVWKLRRKAGRKRNKDYIYFNNNF